MAETLYARIHTGGTNMNRYRKQRRWDDVFLTIFLCAIFGAVAWFAMDVLAVEIAARYVP